MPINEAAELPPEILSRGTIETASVLGVIDQDNVSIVIKKVNRNLLVGAPEVHLAIIDKTDREAGGGAILRLGENVSFPGVCTAYVVGLSSFEGSQRVTILIIPD